MIEFVCKSYGKLIEALQEFPAIPLFYTLLSMEYLGNMIVFNHIYPSTEASPRKKYYNAPRI
jgi:hypothetical protein